MRLFPKLLVSFIAVVVVGMTVVTVLANIVASREVRSFMFRGGMATTASLVQELAGYYRGHQSWDGAEVLLKGDHGMSGMMEQRLTLVDTQGVIVADTKRGEAGQLADEDALAGGRVIEVDGTQVGTLIVEGGMMGNGGFHRGPPGSLDGGGELLVRVNAAIWLAALAAGAAAFVVGGLLAYGLVRPIRLLTQATNALANGNLAHRVDVRSHDEIGDLARSFNAMAEDLEKAERLRRDMTADIAHELRNPLAVLQSNVEAVIDGVLPPTPENLQPLLEQTHVLSHLVDDLRTLALADSGHLDLSRVPTDLAALMRSSAAHFATQAEQKKINLQVESPGHMPLALIDPVRLSQVLSNLLSNAVRHTPEGGQITLSVKDDDGWLKVRIADTGPGIAPDALPHVFERFYRADKSRARAEGGTGLGLAIAKKLVELHGGDIWVESVLGNGAAVSFTVPMNGD